MLIKVIAITCSTTVDISCPVCMYFISDNNIHYQRGSLIDLWGLPKLLPVVNLELWHPDVSYFDKCFCNKENAGSWKPVRMSFVRIRRLLLASKRAGSEISWDCANTLWFKKYSKIHRIFSHREYQSWVDKLIITLSMPLKKQQTL